MTHSLPSTMPSSLRMRLLIGTALLLGLLGLGGCAQQDESLPDPILLPTLDLEPIEQSTADLSAKVIDERDGIPLHSFTSQEAAAGFEVTADEHVLFRCPAGSDIDVQLAHGNSYLWNTVRYWGYEYSGNENANGAAGKTGRDLFDGRFWLSQGERTISNACYGYLHTQDTDTSEMNLNGSSLYYLMVSGGEDVNGNGLLDETEDLDNDCQLDAGEDANGNGALDLAEDANGNGTLDSGFPRSMRFFVSCLDADQDRLNSGDETAFGTDPQQKDTDADGIEDGTEVMGDNPTDPTNPDTDGGGQIDGAEDINANGALDVGETDPTDPADDVIGEAVCGDGVVTGSEGCDPGNVQQNVEAVACTQADDLCNAITCQCAPEGDVVCGDGLIRGAETCDDGGTEDGDGCSAQCAVEDLFVCAGEPSACDIPLPTLPNVSSAAAASSVAEETWNVCANATDFCNKGEEGCIDGDLVCPDQYISVCDGGACGTSTCVGACCRCVPQQTVTSESSSAASSAPASSVAAAAQCGNDIEEAGEACDDGDTLAEGDCSADCLCDQWERVEAFINTYCPSTVPESNNDEIECFAAILKSWTQPKTATTLDYPDINCDGEGVPADVMLLYNIFMVHYPDTQS